MSFNLGVCIRGQKSKGSRRGIQSSKIKIKKKKRKNRKREREKKVKIFAKNSLKVKKEKS